MFNHVLAALVGITAIIVGIVTAIRFDLFSATLNDATCAKTPEEKEREMYKFLNSLDDSREDRYAHDKANRRGMLRQFGGFRSEWVDYASEYGDNFHEYGFSCSCYA